MVEDHLIVGTLIAATLNVVPLIDVFLDRGTLIAGLLKIAVL